MVLTPLPPPMQALPPGTHLADPLPTAARLHPAQLRLLSLTFPPQEKKYVHDLNMLVLRGASLKLLLVGILVRNINVNSLCLR